MNVSKMIIYRRWTHMDNMHCFDSTFRLFDISSTLSKAFCFLGEVKLDFIWLWFYFKNVQISENWAFSLVVHIIAGLNMLCLDREVRARSRDFSSGCDPMHRSCLVVYILRLEVVLSMYKTFFYAHRGKLMGRLQSTCMAGITLGVCKTNKHRSDHLRTR